MMKHCIRIFWLVLLLCGISACGGESLSREGSEEPDTQQPTEETFTLSLSLADSAGNTTTEVGENAPLTLSATLTNQDGNPVTNTVVSFTFDREDLAVFSNDTGSALTNDNGVASINLTVGESSGSGSIVATVDASSAVSATIGFTSQGTDTQRPTTITLTLTDSTGNETNQLSDSTPLTINALLTDQAGTPLADQVVNFSVDREGLVIFSNDSGSALTNAEGIASITITVDGSTGSGVIQATSESISTVTSNISFTSLGAQTTQPANLELLIANDFLLSSGTELVELIAIVKDENNILLEGVEVSFRVDQNASLSGVDDATGEDGTARAFVSTPNFPENRDVTVTATVEGVNPVSLTVPVVGTSISISGAGSLIIDDATPLTLVLTDSDGNGISGEDVVISSSIGGFVLDGEVSNGTTSQTTNIQGVVTVNFTSSVSGEAVISASALNANLEPAFQLSIQQDDFSFSVIPQDEINIGESESLVIRWFRDGSPFANGNVVVTSSRGIVSPSTAMTDANGLATISIDSSFAGPASISAIGDDGMGNEVTARTEVEFIATVPNSISVDATPDLIGPNGQTSTVTAIVRDESGNLVKGQVVDFTIEIDSTGGSISPNNAITDENGVASTVYTSNSVSSDNEIRIKATSGDAEGVTTMTVGNRAFDIVIGTGNEIGIVDASSYVKEFSVFVTDASGRPIADAELTVTAVPPLTGSHEKGSWYWVDDPGVWVPNNYVTNPITTGADCCAVLVCNSEDFIDQNNRLDIGDTFTEDFNGDGELTPGNVAAVLFKDGVNRTNAFGQAVVEVRYPKQFGSWATINLTVSGQSLGTESSQTQTFALVTAASDLTNETVSPPPSPFGVDGLCSSPN